MRLALCVVVMGLVASGGLAGAAQDAVHDRTGPPLVVTTGEGLIRAVPDRAFVVVATETRAAQPRVAQSQNAQVMTAVQQKLREIGLEPDALRTLGFELQPEFDYVDGRQVPRGYVARNRLEVRLDSIDRVGEVIDLVVAAGATNVGAVRFDLKDRDTLEREALRLAVVDARARAEAAAAGAGREIDRVLRIEEQRMGVPPPMPMMAMRAESADLPQTPIAPGEIEVRTQVSLTMALK